MSDSCHPMDCSTPGFPCPPPIPGACWNSWPSSWWCHPTTSSSVVPFSSCLQSFPYQGLFQWASSSGGQSIGVSASTSVLPMNTQGWSLLGWTDWISLQSKGLSRFFSNTTQFKSISSLALSLLYSPTLASIHDYWKSQSLTRRTCVTKVMSLLFNMLSRLVILRCHQIFTARAQNELKDICKKKKNTKNRHMHQALIYWNNSCPVGSVPPVEWRHWSSLSLRLSLSPFTW